MLLLSPDFSSEEQLKSHTKECQTVSVEMQLTYNSKCSNITLGLSLSSYVASVQPTSGQIKVLSTTESTPMNYVNTFLILSNNLLGISD